MFYVVNREGNYEIVCDDEIKAGDKIVFGPGRYTSCQAVHAEYLYQLWYGYSAQNRVRDRLFSGLPVYGILFFIKLALLLFRVTCLQQPILSKK